MGCQSKRRGENCGACRCGFHPHPSPLPSRERGPAVLHRWTGWAGFWGEAGDGIATWFDRLTMSGCAPRNDGRVANFTLTPALSHRGRGGLPFYIDGQDGQDFEVRRISPSPQPLSHRGRGAFDRLTMSGWAPRNDKVRDFLNLKEEGPGGPDPSPWKRLLREWG